MSETYEHAVEPRAVVEAQGGGVDDLQLSGEHLVDAALVEIVAVVEDAADAGAVGAAFAARVEEGGLGGFELDFVVGVAGDAAGDEDFVVHFL